MVSAMRVVVCGVGGVTFLPQKFHRAQKEARAQFPAHHVGPLVDQQRQVAVGLNPFLEGPADDRFRGRAHDQWLLKHFAAADGHNGQLRREALDVLGFFFEEALRDEQREIGVFMAGFLKTAIQPIPDAFPQLIAVGLDDHAAAHGRIVGQVGFLHDIGIPSGKIFRLWCDALLRHGGLLLTCDTSGNPAFAENSLVIENPGARRRAPHTGPIVTAFGAIVTGQAMLTDSVCFRSVLPYAIITPFLCRSRITRRV